MNLVYAEASWSLKPLSRSCQMYKHLDREEQYQIQSLLNAKLTITNIARLLDRQRSTINRELSRCRGLRGYRAEQACSKAFERAHNSFLARRVEARI